MRKFEIEQKLQKNLAKLFHKDRKRYEILMKKMDEILACADVDHFKNLRRPMQHLKSVHIDSHFVLVFRYEPATDRVFFYDFDHHDKIFG